MNLIQGLEKKDCHMSVRELMLSSGRRIPGGRGQPGLAFQEATAAVCGGHCIERAEKVRVELQNYPEEKGSQEEGPGTALRELKTRVRRKQNRQSRRSAGEGRTRGETKRSII